MIPWEGAEKSKERDRYHAEFLAELKKPEKEEFYSYIYTIYNTLQNEEMWKNDPYIDVLIQVNRNARMLSKALKRLATFIRKIIERMVNEGTFESLTPSFAYDSMPEIPLASR